MAIGYSKIYNGVNLVPENTTAPSVAGDIRYNSSLNLFEVFTTASDQIVLANAVQTLTNKTFSGGISTSSIINGSGTLNINSSGTITVPNATDTLVGRATTDTLSNKTLDNTTVLTIKDGNLTIQNSADITKILKISASNITTGNTLTLQVPSGITADTIVTANANQTLTNKTISGNTATNLTNAAGTVNFPVTGTITIPGATDTLVGRATTDTLTNKTLSGNTATNFVNGSGTLNINSSGTITVPNATDTLVGKATTDTFTNKSISGSTNTLTNIPANTALTSQVSITNGGTGQSTANAGFNALSPMTTGGDLIYGGTSGAATRLANGSAGQVLTSSGGTAAPSWATPGGAPTGSVLMWTTNTAPSGYLLCDGSAVSRTTYATLFALISTTYGSGDGSTTFNVPNTQGIFVRGAGSQTISSISYSGTNGTKQGDQMQGHIHTVSPSANYGQVNNTVAGIGSSGNQGNNGSSPITISSPTSDGTNGTPRTGTETRPANISLYYIIKT